MDILLAIFYFIVSLFIIYKVKFFRINNIPIKWLGIVFTIKVLFGVALTIIYTYYYPDRSTADIFKYFDDSKIIYDALNSSPEDFFRMLFGVYNDNHHFHQYYDQMNNWYREYESNLYNDSHTIIRLNALFRIFSFGSFHVHTVFMCLISLAGLTAIYKTFIHYLASIPKILFVAVFLIPSVLFWGSGVLKEGLLLLGLGFLVYHFHEIINKKYSVYQLFWIPFSLLLLLYLKFYILISLIPALIIFFVLYKTSKKYMLLKCIGVLVATFFIGVNINYIFHNYDALSLIFLKQRDFINLAQHMNSQSFIDIPRLEPNVLSLIKNIPSALYNTFLRPHFFDINSFIEFIAVVENLIILTVIGFCIWFRKINKDIIPIIAFSITFVIVLYTIIGLVTPVMGAIVRYKVPALPFLIIGFLLILDVERVKRKFGWFEKS